MTDHPLPSKKEKQSKNYVIRNKNVIETPLMKYQTSAFEAAYTQFNELTEHFNYGFNPDTMVIYEKVCKRIAEAEAIESSTALHDYNPHINDQFRFNDQVPIQFGGFGPFLHPQLTKLNQYQAPFDSEALMKMTLMSFYYKNCQNIKTSSPIIELLKAINNKDQKQLSIVDRISRNIQIVFDKSLDSIKKSKAPKQEKKKEEVGKKKIEKHQEEEFVNAYDELIKKNIKKQKVQDAAPELQTQVKKEQIKQSETEVPVYIRKRPESFQDQPTKKRQHKESHYDPSKKDDQSHYSSKNTYRFLKKFKQEQKSIQDYKRSEYSSESSSEREKSLESSLEKDQRLHSKTKGNSHKEEAQKRKKSKHIKKNKNKKKVKKNKRNTRHYKHKSKSSKKSKRSNKHNK